MQEQFAEKFIQRRNQAKRWFLEVPESLTRNLSGYFQFQSCCSNSPLISNIPEHYCVQLIFAPDG